MNKTVKKIVVNCCRLLLAVVFIFSGYVKAVDPHGTQYKIQDYLAAAGLPGLLPDWLSVGLSVGLSSIEFCLGVFMLFAIRRRLVSKIMVAFLLVMTALTLWLAIANPIKDCGCFGDALYLTNGQTFWKNVVLLAAALVTAWQPRMMPRLIRRSTQWIVINYTVLFVLASAIWSLYYLPLFDFRPYHVGANIKQGMEMPPDAKPPKYETTFILERNGERREFSLQDYPDSSWTFVDSRTELVESGYEPPIHDFSITDREGNDRTQDILDQRGYSFLLIAPLLEQADDSNFGDINRISEFAKAHGYGFYGLTASNDKAIAHWRDVTGSEYPFYSTDATTLKTIVRSNPGLLLLKDATIVGKWSYNNLPSFGDGDLAQQLQTKSTTVKLSFVVLWYVVPLLLLTLADRLWAWTKWVRIGRRRSRHHRAYASSHHSR